MASELKEIAEQTAEQAVTAADLAAGAAVVVAEAGTAVGAHPVRTSRRLGRRGAAVNRRLVRKAEKSIVEGGEVVDGLMPERVALAGIRLVKGRAHRRDLVGDAAYRMLEMVNGGLEAVLRTLNRFERATQPPARPGSGRKRTAGGASLTKATRAAGRKTRRTAGSARSSVRRGAAQARRTENRQTAR